MLDAVDLVSTRCDLSRRVPEQVELRLLLDRVALCIHLLVAGRLILSLDLGLLFECALESVPVFEEPCSCALGLVIRESTLEVESIGVDPLTCRQLPVLPVTSHLHACFFEQVGAIASFLSIFPPA